MRQLFFDIHVVIAYLMAGYALLTFWLEYRVTRLEAGTSAFEKWNRIFLNTNRIFSYLLVLTFLLGGYLGTPYFKAGILWVYGKILLFVILLGLMGAVGGKALKMRREAAANPEKREMLLLAARNKMNLYKLSQLFLVALLFYLAYGKPF